MCTDSNRQTQLRQAALDHHTYPVAGKQAITTSKQLINPHDLALAYSPAVTAPCEEIVKDPNTALKYTNLGNLVAVITNGSAGLGQDNIGPLAAKPVMEGKAVLYKNFANIDVFDLEIDASDPDQLVAIIAALELTFGGIDLEDIKAPDCFYVERKLCERMKILVFHHDQHGTAIMVRETILIGLKVAGKDIKKIKLVPSGAGATALACLGLLIKLGVAREKIFMTDLAGVVFEDRTELMDDEKRVYAQATPARTLGRSSTARRPIWASQRAAC
jgi:malate dehydrogenase (oxaloacetate-decarboxylating)(NADP+)